MFKSPLSPEQWAEARRLRGEGATFAAIGKQFAVSHDAIAARARRESWPSPARANSKSKASLPADPAAVRRGLARRVYRVMDLNLSLMELRMEKQLKQAKKQKDGDMPAGDVEKDMRQLAATMKTIEQATELDPDLHRSADGGARPADARAGASEAEAFHREIAERLEKLVPRS
jgi:hypothetical protein